MSLNSNMRFSEIPNVEKQRSTFDRSFTHKTSMNSSDLVPLAWDEVLPGDTFTVDFSHLTRMTTPIAPVADNLVMDVFAFYVPTRLLWEHWEEFWGENKTTYWEQPTTYVTPKLQFYTGTNDQAVKPGSLLNYLGIPAGYLPTSANYDEKLTSLPVRGYCKIWNDWFRDENLQEPLVEYTGDASTYCPNITTAWDETNYVTNVPEGECCAKVNKLHDYFTSALPAPQKGPSIGIIGDMGKVPVGTMLSSHPSIGTPLSPGGVIPTEYKTNTSTSMATGMVYHQTTKALTYGTSKEGYTDTGASSSLTQHDIEPTNLWADLSYATLNTINELRTAFAIQRYYEACARGGTRYTEWLQNIFSVTSPDARLQRAEFLGSRRFNINMDQVLQTSGTGSTGQVTPQGNTAAFSCTANSDNLCTYSATEHGYFYVLAAIRIAGHSYAQGISKQWLRNSWEDYYIPQFAHLGEQEIKNMEIYADGTSADEGTFGYQERWAEYRYKPNMVTGIMAPNVTGNLAIWNYCDKYTSLPMLSSEWIHEDPSNVQRTLAVQNQPQFIVDSYINMKWTRVMPLYSVPGLLDHF